jgi:pentatricopeptide repeat protein
VVLPLARGVQAFGAGAYDDAIRWLEPLDGQLVRVGGSHAQWEVFEDTLLQAYLRAGQFERAEALLRRRLARRSSARDVVWLEQAVTAQPAT